MVEGADRPHEVATPLRAALAAGSLQGPDLLAMIEAREIEADPEIPTLSAWRAWLLQGPGSLAVAASRLLGAPDTELDRQRALGAGYGVAGVLRSIPSLARQGRCLLPADLLGRHGLTQYDVIHEPANPALAPVRDTLAAEGRTLLGAPRRCARLDRRLLAGGAGPAGSGAPWARRRAPADRGSGFSYAVGFDRLQLEEKTGGDVPSPQPPRH